MTTGHLVRWASVNGNYARIHWDLPYAMLRQGLPNVVVNGSLKNEYLYILMQRFAGEAGWVRKMYLDGIGYVKCEIGLRNDRGKTSQGWAEVALPTRQQMLPLVWQ